MEPLIECVNGRCADVHVQKLGRDGQSADDAAATDHGTAGGGVSEWAQPSARQISQHSREQGRDAEEGEEPHHVRYRGQDDG